LLRHRDEKEKKVNKVRGTEEAEGKQGEDIRPAKSTPCRKLSAVALEQQ